MSQPHKSIEQSPNMWCGRSWEGLVDRRCVAFAHAQSMREVTEAEIDSVVPSFLEFFGAEGGELFANEEEWIFQSLSKKNVPRPVLRAYSEHVEISSFVESLSLEIEAGRPDPDVVRRLGDLLEQHLLLEEEEIRPLLARFPSSPVAAESSVFPRRKSFTTHSPLGNPQEDSPMPATSARMTAPMRRLLQMHLTDLERRIQSLDEQQAGEDNVEATALLMELERERIDISDALRDATLIDDEPFDTEAIEVGDTVTVRDPRDETERYVLVDGKVKSRARSDWVSVSSPLGTALLGRSKGDEVSVDSPAGPMNYLILDFERDSEGALTAVTSMKGHSPSTLTALSSEPSLG